MCIDFARCAACFLAAMNLVFCGAVLKRGNAYAEITLTTGCAPRQRASQF
jgi:hypothetical protein